MSQGIFDVNSYLLTLGVNSNITVIGAPFSATKMITTQGVFSNIGLKKFFSTLAASIYLSNWYFRQIYAGCTHH